MRTSYELLATQPFTIYIKPKEPPNGQQTTDNRRQRIVYAATHQKPLSESNSNANLHKPLNFLSIVLCVVVVLANRCWPQPRAARRRCLARLSCRQLRGQRSEPGKGSPGYRYNHKGVCSLLFAELHSIFICLSTQYL